MKSKRDSTAYARASQRGKQVKERVDEAESQGLGSYFANLPSAITTHILLQLPIKSVSICRCVCRTWNALISNPHFAKLRYERAPFGVMIRTSDSRLVARTLHLLENEPEKCESECNNHMKLEPKFKLPLRGSRIVLEKMQRRRHISSKPEVDKFEVVNSCNGLLCLCDPCPRDPLVVCNPVTGEFIRLPKATRIEPTWIPTYPGFGFQPKTNEYKVIRMWKRYVKRPRDSHEGVFEDLLVEMHTLGTPTWRNVRVDPRFFIGRLRFPTCVNGALHWISFDGWKRSILCFNFESERFQSFPSPPHLLENEGIQDTRRISMVELRGFLYICDASSCNSCSMWVMQKYGIGESWTKVFSIDTLGRPRWPYGLCWPVKHFEKGAAILMQYSYNCFVYYEPEKDGFKSFRVHGTQSILFEVIPHIPSLISLKDAVKGDNIEVLSVHSRCAKFKLQEENEVLFLARDCSDVKNLVKSTPPKK